MLLLIEVVVFQKKFLNTLLQSNNNTHNSIACSVSLLFLSSWDVICLSVFCVAGAGSTGVSDISDSLSEMIIQHFFV